MPIGILQGTSKEAMRDHNLSALLTEIHRNGEMSRAELGERLGLSKTTIAELVDELEQLRLLSRVGSESRSSAGRPSFVVGPNESPLVFVLNPERDGISAGLVNLRGEIVWENFEARDALYSPREFVQTVERLFAAVAGEFSDRIFATSVVLPGAIEKDTGLLIAAPSLDWNSVELAQDVESIVTMPVSLINNGHAATIAEHHFGFATHMRNAVCIISGAGGVGGGVIVNRALVEGERGIAGEIGKMRIHDSDIGLPGNMSFGHLMQEHAIAEAMDVHARVLTNALATLRDLFDPEGIVVLGYLGHLLEAKRESILNELNDGALIQRTHEFLISRPEGLKSMMLIGGAERAWAGLIQNPRQGLRK